jgi:Arc/MetJ family transcription regulator
MHIDMYDKCIFLERADMRTTLNLDDSLVERASKLTGIKEKTALIHKGLESLISLESGRRLAALGGSEQNIRAPRRRRPE